MKTAGLGKKLSFVLGSFIIVGTVLIVYFHAPPAPIVTAGLLAVLITASLHLFSK